MQSSLFRRLGAEFDEGGVRTGKDDSNCPSGDDLCMKAKK